MWAGLPGITPRLLVTRCKYREFLSELAVDMARPERGILIFNDENLAELNPRSNATEEDFAFLGLVFGLALANRETFPITFVPCFYQRMMNQSLSLTFDDLRLAHPRIHKSLESLRYVVNGLVQHATERCRSWTLISRHTGLATSPTRTSCQTAAASV